MTKVAPLQSTIPLIRVRRVEMSKLGYVVIELVQIDEELFTYWQGKKLEW